jgi:hypothetical protein
MNQALSEQVAAAEIKFAASRERTRTAASMLCETFQSKFARPSTLAWAAGAGVLLGKFMLRPSRRHVHTRDGLTKTGIAAALLSRFGWKSLAGAALQMWMSRRHAPPPFPMTPPLHVTPPRVSARTLGATLH